MSTDENVTMTSEDEEQSKKLAALLDTSHPLLQLLRERAPGTYKHSQALESIIEGLSAALDLDVTFMKVAALYHDIGKICNPKYFTENQLEDEDLHADLNPWISAQVMLFYHSHQILQHLLVVYMLKLIVLVTLFQTGSSVTVTFK